MNIPLVLIPLVADYLGLRDCLRLKWTTKENYEVLKGEYTLMNLYWPSGLMGKRTTKQWRWKTGTVYRITTEPVLYGSRRPPDVRLMVSIRQHPKARYLTKLYDSHNEYGFKPLRPSFIYSEFFHRQYHKDPEVKWMVDKILN
jgi:hypothetical protein